MGTSGLPIAPSHLLVSAIGSETRVDGLRDIAEFFRDPTPIKAMVHKQGERSSPSSFAFVRWPYKHSPSSN